jgi:hypothetical protein
MKSATFKAVCYQCSFEGRSETSLCPVCSFPVILEPETTPPGGFRLEDILARETVRDGGPPLPGVDPGKRKAQLLAEARRERRASQARPATLPPASVPMPSPMRAHPRKQIRGGTVTPARGGWARGAVVGVLCASALAAGVLIAALQSM